MSLKMNAEEVKVGGYQILTLLLLSVNFIIMAMSHALTIFYKYTPKFYCQVNSNNSISDVMKNRTYGCSKNCTSGQYLFETKNFYEKSVAMEWQLICEKEGLLRAGSDVYYAGLLFGAFFAGFIIDRFGRLPVLAVCLYAQGIMSVALNVVQEYKLFLVFRGLQGFFMQGLESCTFVLCMELFPVKFRTLVALIILSMRSFGLAFISGLSYAIPDWRILQLVVSVPTAITVLYIWLIPESPRWLLAMGKTMEAEMLLERITNYNSLCGPSKKNKNSSKLQQLQQNDDHEKPQKPKRKIRTTDVDIKSDVEKSLDESKNLLHSQDTESLDVHGNSERNNAETTNTSIEEKTELPSELDIEEIAKASLMVVPDEKCTNDNGEKSPASYLLVSREALAITENTRQNNKSGIRGFFESRFIGRTCVIAMFLWFTSSLAFHALVTLPHRISSERHVSLTLAAGMELVSFIFVYLLVSSRCCGRRIPLCASQIIVGFACFVIALFAHIFPQPGARWLAYTKTIIVVIARVANIGTFFVLRLLVIELFPTISRGTGVGLCVTAEMIGGLLTPLVLMLNIQVSELSRFLIGFLCIFTGFLTFTLPETSRDVLPDSTEDAKSLGRNNNNKDAEHAKNSGVLREKLFSEDWVDAGNGIIVDFTDNKNSE